jgi:Tfp pilus assembly protein PilN
VNPLEPQDPRGTATGTSELPLRAAPVVAPAPLLERVEPLNLARRPFLNSRPVVRVALLLWLLGLGLLLVNLWQFLGYRARSADKREQIARSEAEIERQRRVLASLQKTLDGFALDTQNQKVDFLNKQIAERTFSWSQLLDRIAERLPNDVRLNRLAPLTGDKAERQRQRLGATGVRRSTQASDLVPLLITGESRNDEALLSFVDSLFKPPFTDANLAREEREEDGKTLKFEISVQYRPGPPPAAGAAPGSGPAPRIEELPMPTSDVAAPSPAPGASVTPAPGVTAAPGAVAPAPGTGVAPAPQAPTAVQGISPESAAPQTPPRPAAPRLVPRPAPRTTLRRQPPPPAEEQPEGRP